LARTVLSICRRTALRTRSALARSPRIAFQLVRLASIILFLSVFSPRVALADNTNGTNEDTLAVNGFDYEAPMKRNGGLCLAAKTALGLAICCAALTSYAQSTPDGSITTLHSLSVSTAAKPAAIPSLLMEGRGQIGQSSNPCSSASCAGTFTATLTGRPFVKASLTLNLEVNRLPDEFTGCNQVRGTGEINGNAYIVNLVGQLCAPGIGYTLSGTVQIFAPAVPTAAAAVGTLLAFGGTNIPADPVPHSGPSLVSLIGASGNIPLLLP
jgi:hypothetical protein